MLSLCRLVIAALLLLGSTTVLAQDDEAGASGRLHGVLSKLKELGASLFRQDVEKKPFNFNFDARQSVLLARALNQQGGLLNAHLLQQTDDEPPAIFALLVHKKSTALRQLLKSLATVQDINRTVLVVAFDGVFPSVWEAVGAVDFMPVKLLVNPYSAHLESNSGAFPGEDPIFAEKEGVDEGSGKTLYHGFDQYKNPREVRVTSLKHHWWWTINTLFAGRAFPLRKPQAIMYLEDDWVVTPDFLLAAESLVRWSQHHCNGCLLGMGSHKKVSNADHHAVTFADPGSANLGLVLTHALWQKITNSTAFCMYDEYNWDWSLKHVFSLHKPAHYVTLTVARAKHMGRCGLHGDKAILDLEATKCDYSKDWELWTQETSQLRAPASLPLDDHWHEVGGRQVISTQGNGYGGWGSDEDHSHCIAVQRGELF